MRIVSNLDALRRARAHGAAVEVVPHQGGPLRQRIAGLWRARRCDYAVINCSPTDLFWYCLLKVVWPFSRVRIVSLDTVLPVPETDRWGRRLGLWVKRFLFRRVHLFIEYFKDTAGYEHHYGMARSKFRYVPFKVNRLERVTRTPVRDDGYVFCGGNTRRDFQTLLAAVTGLPYPVKIVTMQERIIHGHGSSLDERRLPPNVEVVRHDGGDSFLDFVAAARLVALPIKRANISASGIGVYLAAMALGKCVVISEGPAVNDVVPPGAAIIVPPEDPAALRAAIERAWLDDERRAHVAAAGQRYALALGGEDRLCQSVLDVLVADRAGAPAVSEHAVTSSGAAR